MLKKLICLLFLCSILLTVACTPKTTVGASEYTEPKYTTSNMNYFTYRDRFYYIKNGYLYYCALEDLKDIKKYEKCLCFDPICDHTSSNRCMGYIGSGLPTICIRTIENATYLFASYTSRPSNTCEIAQINISNAEKTVLVKSLENRLNTFFVTDDLLVFEESTLPYSLIKAYSLIDKKLYELPNEDEDTYRLIGYDNGLIYYNDIAGNVYSNSPILDNEEKIFTGILPYGYKVYNGDLYFPCNMESEKVPEVDWISFNSIDVGRTPLDSPSAANYKTVAKDVCSFGKTSHFVFDDTLYYLPSKPAYIGQFIESFEGISETMTHTVVDEHDGTLCSVDLQKLRKANLIEGLEYNIYDLIYASPEYVIFRSNASGNRTDIPFSSLAATFVYEVQTKECYMIVD